ncbi:hypothetical protein SAMN00120144_1591 [Hymenobacter roseosalivarius DSM 11622]|uniref:Uncharacterized protein n=1 Tax=Hymenobacter roseosalivarius DSM 11622 TaxID=645990 RepID=A0A1W1VXV7_9BACT|nr:hypothetical protein [Hymenobacter roseosalivarius]SMB97704.1 hypothetical protein SAMN00120144_1591 [Hymenobacter roseosalivarius DSM 11622]
MANDQTQPDQQPTDSRAIQQGTVSQSDQRQPEGRQASGDGNDSLRGLNADDNSGSGGTEGGQEIKSENVSTSTTYDAPGNAAEGDVGGSTTSSGTGVSGGETGRVNL